MADNAHRDITMLDIEIVAQLQKKLINEKETVRSRLEDALITLTGLDISNVPTAHLIKLCRRESDSLHEDGLRLEKIDAALCSIHTGLYGLCADCEESIDLEDLQSDPAELRCQECRNHNHYHHLKASS
ncbi:TraR/DksA family transcriptional regulator [Enterovibrio calviensis]|uniref:TraR/DksA family transcriptional regulator n=1 Tax=Enterovibrio calviensis TaxID=91359 RepID=UPI000A6312BE|nr:DksA protein [Enterovibrio calviensis]